MEKAIEWVKNHKPHTAAIVIVVVAVIAVSIAAASGAFTQQDKTTTDEQKTVDVTLNVTADNGWDENSTPAIAHIESEGNDVDFYHAVTPDAEGNKGTSTVALAEGDNSGSTSSKPSQSSQPSKPAHTHTWVNHTATRQVWVSNWVDVPDYGTQQVAVGTKYIFAYDGYTTTDINDTKAHARALIMQGVPENYRTETIYETQTVQTGSHKEDHGSYKTETYVDYVYCSSCGARQ